MDNKSFLLITLLVDNSMEASFKLKLKMLFVPSSNKGSIIWNVNSRRMKRDPNEFKPIKKYKDTENGMVERGFHVGPLNKR